MDCLNCPLIQEEIERRLNIYGFEEMKQYPQYEEEILNEICRACFCDKFDSKIFMTNSQGCEDYPSRSIKKGKKGKKRRTRREYDAKHKKHLEELSDLPGYPSGARKKDKTYTYASETGYITSISPFYCRTYKGKGYTYLKKSSNRKVRRTTEILLKGNTYRKIFDLWWEYC